MYSVARRMGCLILGAADGVSYSTDKREGVVRISSERIL